MNKIVIYLLLSFCLASCSRTIQTTSGRSYLEQYNSVPVVVKDGDSIDIEEQIRQVANVEPTLKFPARIGLARIDRRGLSTVPGEEVEAWLKTLEKLGDGFGEFIPVNPMIAEMASTSVASQDNNRLATNVMNKIRLGAARQHLDAVIIYEVYSKAETESNILSIANLTIIGGYILPSRAIEAEGFANAILIDVIQGYPYGTVDVVLDKEEAYATRNGASNRKHELSEQVKTKAAIKLTEEVGAMLISLRRELKNIHPTEL